MVKLLSQMHQLISYAVTITDNLGCQITKNISVSQPPEIVITCSGTAVSAKGKSDGLGNINISGGTPNYTLGWSGPLSGQIQSVAGVNSIPNLSAGNYFYNGY
jgi:large repetitive protein